MVEEDVIGGAGVVNNSTTRPSNLVEPDDDATGAGIKPKHLSDNGNGKFVVSPSRLLGSLRLEMIPRA